MSVYGFIYFATPVCCRCQQLKVGVWLQLVSLSLADNALEGTLPDSWKLNKVKHNGCTTIDCCVFSK